MIRRLSAILLAVAPAPAIEIDGLTLPGMAVRVSSPVQEIIAEIKVQEGSTVKQGDVLARLHNEKEQAEHERAVHIVEKREFDSQAASSLAADKITSREKALEAQIELKLAKVDQELARRKLDEKTIRSPLDGIVVRKLKEVGESVDRVEPMFEIVNVDRLFLQFYVERRVVAALETGREIPFWITGESGKKLLAKVDFVSPGADPSSGLFRVKLVFDNPQRLVSAGVRVTAGFPDPPK